MISAYVTLAPTIPSVSPQGNGSVTTEPKQERISLATLPDVGEFRRVMEHFASLAFRCGPSKDTGFVIEGQASLFETIFDVSIRKLGSGFQVLGRDGERAATLPLDPLAPQIRKLVASITFPTPDRPDAVNGGVSN